MKALFLVGTILAALAAIANASMKDWSEMGAWIAVACFNFACYKESK